MTTKQQVEDLLHDEGRTIPERMAALRDLCGLSGPVQQLLDESWERQDWDTFELAVIAGFESPDTSMTKVLCTALESDQPAVPTEDILLLLADIKDPEATETLRSVLEDPPEWDEFYQPPAKASGRWLPSARPVHARSWKQRGRTATSSSANGLTTSCRSGGDRGQLGWKRAGFCPIARATGTTMVQTSRSCSTARSTRSVVKRAKSKSMPMGGSSMLMPPARLALHGRSSRLSLRRALTCSRSGPLTPLPAAALRAHARSGLPS